jgi:glycosyltransferase involved in cell wall biosynthesis
MSSELSSDLLSGSAERPEVSVVIPVYNGATYIRESLTYLKSFLERAFASYEIIAVDDGSTDGTGPALESLAGPRLRVIGLEKNLGKYGALIRGMAACRGMSCLFTDADIPYDLEAIPYIVRLINERGFHIVIGDRTLRESRSHRSVPLIRRIATRVYSFFLGILVTGGLFDTQCGLKGFRSDVAAALFPLVRDWGFSGDAEALYIALKYNLEVKRIPARLQRNGPTTVRFLTSSMRMLWRITHLRAKWISGYYASDALSRIAEQPYWEWPSIRSGHHSSEQTQPKLDQVP